MTGATADVLVFSQNQIIGKSKLLDPWSITVYEATTYIDSFIFNITPRDPVVNLSYWALLDYTAVIYLLWYIQKSRLITTLCQANASVKPWPYGSFFLLPKRIFTCTPNNYLFIDFICYPLTGGFIILVFFGRLFLLLPFSTDKALTHRVLNVFPAQNVSFKSTNTSCTTL